jgi:hypothetical protein
MNEAPSIGVALSGGGHRATVFSLGALLYLTDAGANRSVATITSVSGGSLLNAFVALQDQPFNKYSAQEFEERVARLAQCVAGNLRRWTLVVRLTFALLLVLVLCWATFLDSGAFLVASAAILVAFGVLLGPASGGFLFGHWCTWLYLAPVIWGPLAMITCIVERRAIVTWLSASGFSAESMPFADFIWGGALLMLLLAWGALAQQRHAIAGLAYGRMLARLRGMPSGSGPKLEDMHGAGIRHVLCATELHAGRHAYFTHDLVYSRGFGLGGPGGLPLRVAVQLSANFPGGFPPRILHASRFGFELADPKELRWKFEYSDVWGPSHSVPRWMVLSDGGVFDNTADAWYLDADDRHTRLDVELNKVLAQELKIWREKKKAATGLDDWGITKRYDLPVYHPEFRDPFDRRHKTLLDRLIAIKQVPQRLIVINAGRPEPWQSLWSVWIPLLGELTGLSKISSTMYNNGTSTRLRDLRARFAEGKPEGAVIDIEEDLLSSAYDAHSGHSGGYMGTPLDRVGRSRQATGYFQGELKWNESTPELDAINKLADLDTKVATTLAPLGIDVTARLLYHGYLQTMVTLHIEFGYPLLYPRPTLQDFLELANGRLRQRRPVPSAG